MVHHKHCLRGMLINIVLRLVPPDWCARCWHVRDSLRAQVTALQFTGVGAGRGDIAQEGLEGVVRITTRGMWIDEGRLLMEMQMAAETALRKVRRNSTIVYIERTISNEIRKVGNSAIAAATH